MACAGAAAAAGVLELRHFPVVRSSWPGRRRPWLAVASATRIIAAPRSPGGATAGSAGPGPARALTPTAGEAAEPIGGVTRDRTCSAGSGDGAGSLS